MSKHRTGQTKQEKREARADQMTAQITQQSVNKLADELLLTIKNNCKLLEAQFVRFDSKRDRHRSPFNTYCEV